MHSIIHGVDSHIFVFVNSACDAMFGVRAVREFTVKFDIGICGGVVTFILSVLLTAHMTRCLAFALFAGSLSNFTLAYVQSSIARCGGERVGGGCRAFTYLIVVTFCVWDCASRFRCG